MYGLQARLRSGSEWFLTDRIYKSEKFRSIAMKALQGGVHFEYREVSLSKDQKAYRSALKAARR